MKLIINARFLAQQQSGVQHFAAGLLQALREKGVEMELLAPKGTAVPPDLNVRCIGPRKGFWWEQYFLPRYVKRKDALLLNLCNSAPLLLRSQVVTIHDLAFEQKQRGWFRPSFRAWYKFMIPRVCRKAKFILTVSEFSKRELVKHYRIAADKIFVVPNGLNDLPPATENRLHNSYFVMTGICNPRKNAAEIFRYIDMIDAMNCKLVALKGDSSVFVETALPKHRAITYLDHIPAKDYLELLKNAKALIYPSLYEGFGIPILESLCLQTPVIAADLEVYRECFGDLPLYFRHGDRESFSKALEASETKQIPASSVDELKEKYNFKRAADLLLQQLESTGKV